MWPQQTLFKTLRQPFPLRSILLGVLLFGLLNLSFSAGVTHSPLNARFNFKYGNFLPAKLEMLNVLPDVPQMLFLGTSQTNNGFIPSEFEQTAPDQLSSFNLGLPNNHYDIMLAYLRFHQSKYGKPRQLLIELSPSIQEKNASLYYLPALYYRTLIEQSPSLTGDYLSNPLMAQNVKEELFASSLSSLHQYRYTLSPINLLGRLTTRLSRFMPTAEANTIEATEPASAAAPSFTQLPKLVITDEMTARGWYPKEQSPHMLTSEGLKLSVAEAKKYYIDAQDSVNFEKLDALLAYCQQQKIPVVLVSWPNHPAFLSVFKQSKLNQAYTEGLSLLLKKYPVRHINLNQVSLGKKDAAMFADPRHLTPRGAVLYSRRLGQELARL